MCSCSLRDILLKIERDLSKSKKDTSISGVIFSRTTLYRLWDLQTHKVHIPGPSIESSSAPFYDGDRCLFEHMGDATPRSLFDGEWPSYNVTLGCYPGAIKVELYNMR